jgi:hypothetical protein
MQLADATLQLEQPNSVHTSIDGASVPAAFATWPLPVPVALAPMRTSSVHLHDFLCRAAFPAHIDIQHPTDQKLSRDFVTCSFSMHDVPSLAPDVTSSSLASSLRGGDAAAVNADQVSQRSAISPSHRKGCPTRSSETPAHDYVDHVGKDGTSTSTLCTSALPITEEVSTSAEVASLEAPAGGRRLEQQRSTGSPMPSALATEATSLPPAPSLHSQEFASADMDAMCTSSARTHAPSDALPEGAEPSYEFAPQLIAATSSAVLALPPPHTAPLPAVDVRAEPAGPGDLQSKTTDTAGAAVEPVSSQDAHLLSREMEESLSHSSRTSWLHAPDGTVRRTSSRECSLADLDSITHASVNACPQQQTTIVAERAEAGSNVETSPPTGLPIRLCSDAFLHNTPDSTLSRMSAARSQAPLLQDQRDSESVSPSPREPDTSVAASSMPAAAGQQVHIPDRPRPAQNGRGGMPLLSSSASSCQVPRSDLSMTITSQALYRPLHLRSNHSLQQQHSSSDADTTCTPSAAAAAPASRLLRRTGASLKRAIASSFHKVKSFTSRASSSRQQATGGDSLQSTRLHHEQQNRPPERVSFVPESALFKSIQESIQSLTDDECDPCEISHNAASDSERAETADVIDRLPRSGLRCSSTSASPSRIRVHNSTELDPLPLNSESQAPHFCASPEQSAPKQLPEIESLQGSIAGDATTVLPPDNATRLVTPRQASESLKQQQGDVGRPRLDVSPKNSPFRLRPGYADNQHQRSQGRRHAAAPQQRNVLKACFCGQLDQDEVSI